MWRCTNCHDLFVGKCGDVQIVTTYMSVNVEMYKLSHDILSITGDIARVCGQFF